MEIKSRTKIENTLAETDVETGGIPEVAEYPAWIFDRRGGGLTYNDKCMFSSVIVKIFDEAVMNARDEYVRCNGTNNPVTSIDIVLAKDHFSVVNYGGNGISITKNAEGIYGPTLAFSVFETSGNYDKVKKSSTAGKNGHGAKLINIFSKKFTVSLSDGKNTFIQTWTNNMNTAGVPKVAPTDDPTPFVYIKSHVDLDYFKINSLEDYNIMDVLVSRAHQVASMCDGCPFMLNGASIKYTCFGQFVSRNICGTTRSLMSGGPDDQSIEIVVGESKTKRPLSFVNGVCTVSNGTHVDYVLNNIIEVMSLSMKKDLEGIQPQTIKQKLKESIFVAISVHLSKVQFNGQAKEGLKVPATELDKIFKLGANPELGGFVADVIETFALLDKFKQLIQEAKADKIKKDFVQERKKKVIVEKYVPAANVGKPGSILVLTEGDSAKTFFSAGLTEAPESVSNNVGLFPLKGKPINAVKNSDEKIYGNSEFLNLCRILALDSKTPNYESVAIVADADVDGHHIKGLIMALFNSNHMPIKYNGQSIPPIMKPGFLKTLRTPIIKATFKGRGKNEPIMFYSQREFDFWALQNDEAVSADRYDIKYYKGLGSYEEDDVKFMFEKGINFVDIDMSELGAGFGRHVDKQFEGFRDNVERNRATIATVFGKMTDVRKEWLSNHMRDISLFQREINTIFKHVEIKEGDVIPTFNEWLKNKGLDQMPHKEDFLNDRDFNVFDQFTRPTPITGKESGYDVINDDVIVFARASTERVIPDVMDGLKEVQRKIVYYLLNHNVNREKVSVLASDISKKTDYHHGEVSMQEAIICMGQQFPGSNNVNLLTPLGQFGSRWGNGHDHSASRYIYASNTEYLRHIFRREDDVILERKFEDGILIEPKCFWPIIPLQLINGVNAIATGWSCTIPSFDPIAIIDDLIYRLKHITAIDADDIPTYDSSFVCSVMVPWYRGFRGYIDECVNDKGEKLLNVFNIEGTYRFDKMKQGRLEKTTLVIEEFPLGFSTAKTIDEMYMLCSLLCDSKVIPKREKSGEKSNEKSTENLEKKHQKILDKLKTVEARSDIFESCSYGYKTGEFKILLKPNVKVEPNGDGIIVYTTRENVDQATGAVETYDVEEHVSHEKLIKMFDMRGKLRTSNIIMYGKNGEIVTYNDHYDMYDHFIGVRYLAYEKRKILQCKRMANEVDKRLCMIRFIKKVLIHEIDASKLTKSTLIQKIESYKGTKDEFIRFPMAEDPTGDKYAYLINIEYYRFTKDMIEKLESEIANLRDEIARYEQVSVKELWRTELLELKEKLIKAFDGKKKGKQEDMAHK